ncbi:MAG: CvpA family protein [Muribaculaceae bacterium]
MTLIDVIMLLLLGVGVVYGYMRGMIKQMSSIMGFVLGIIVCNMMGDSATEVLKEVIPSSAEWPMPSVTTHAMAVIVLFVLVWLSVKVAGMFLKNTIDALHLSILDRIGGSALNVFKYFFGLSILLNLWLLISPKSEIFSTQHALDNKPFEITLNLVPWALGQRDLPSDSIENVATPAPEDESAEGLI